LRFLTFEGRASGSCAGADVPPKDKLQSVWVLISSIDEFDDDQRRLARGPRLEGMDQDAHHFAGARE